MLRLYLDPLFLEHDTGDHPENAGRLRPVLERFRQRHDDGRLQFAKWEPIDDRVLRRLHDSEYIERIGNFAQQGGGRIEVDTVVSQRSDDVARLGVGAVCDAVQRVLSGDIKKALCLIRPPGHHALPDAPMGFCLYNSVAVAAQLALDQFDLDRVLIVDFDVHHGNGTQDAFWRSGQVGFYSIHRFPFYPGTGTSEETGTGDGLGATCNVPMEFGVSRQAFIDKFRGTVEAFAAKIKPQLIMVSAGFDAHREDPVGSLGLETEDFEPLTDIVCRLADEYCQGKLVSTLEGGYNPQALVESIDVHLHHLLTSRQ